MLTLQQTLDDQCDLTGLCADRPLKTSEICKPNAYYGIDSIIKQYTGLPSSYPLKVVIPHGVHFTEYWVWDVEVKSPLPVVWCYPPYRKQAYQRADAKKTVVLASSPFMYVVEMMKTKSMPTRKGTIFFPAHSTHWNTAHMNFDYLAEELTNINDEYKPITVCMYWRDYNLKRHIPFQERGLRIVSAGHIYDSNFLYRLYHLSSKHRYSASNAFGSHVFYSVKAGCSFFLDDKVKYTYKRDPNISKDLPELTSCDLLSLKEHFSVPKPYITANQEKIADFYLGTIYLKSPRGLKKELLRAEILDKSGLWVLNNGVETRFTLPFFLRRFRKTLRSLVRKIRARLLK